MQPARWDGRDRGWKEIPTRSNLQRVPRSDRGFYSYRCAWLLHRFTFIRLVRRSFGHIDGLCASLRGGSWLSARLSRANGKAAQNGDYYRWVLVGHDRTGSKWNLVRSYGGISHSCSGVNHYLHNTHVRHSEPIGGHLSTMWLSNLLIVLVRVLIGASPRWVGSLPSCAQRIYFANHSSHIDTVALWSALPPDLRSRTRPVAAADYWGKTRLRRYVVLNGLNAVLINRSRSDSTADPLKPLHEALEKGDSLIIFPEGTRQAQPLPSQFKAGLFHLAARFPDVELIPVYLENIHRSMPKGTFLPVPMICTVRFGAPLKYFAHEDKQMFLARARDAITGLAR